jgi:hypothetical protein
LNPYPYGNSPLNLSGSTDTSVALADIPKRECAGAAKACGLNGGSAAAGHAI